MQSQQCYCELLIQEQRHRAPPKQPWVVAVTQTQPHGPAVPSRAEEGAMVSYLMPGKGGIWLCGVDAGVGGFRSPPSAMELLVD